MDTKEVAKVIGTIKRLQTFNIDEVLDLVAEIPGGIAEIKTESWNLRGKEYNTTHVSIKDVKALKGLDLNKYKDTVSSETLKAGKLIQKMSFKPSIINQAKNYLPGGMISMEIGGITNNSIGFNFNCRKQERTGAFWPVALEDILKEDKLQLPVQLESMQGLQGQ